MPFMQCSLFFLLFCSVIIVVYLYSRVLALLLCCFILDLLKVFIKTFFIKGLLLILFKFNLFNFVVLKNQPCHQRETEDGLLCW